MTKMRRIQRKSVAGAAWALLNSATEYTLATTTPDGEPVLRVLNGVVVRDWVLFHGALVGEKTDCIGRRAVVSAHRVVTDIPSHFVDERKACPATTYYRSAQAKGLLVEVSDQDLKVEMFQALMDKLQPEGGYCPFDTHRELYATDLRTLQVFGFQILEISGKHSLGQDRPVERTERIVRGLWKRGNLRDLPAIEEILKESPGARPSEWTIEGSHRIVVFPSETMVEQHAALLADQYWRKGCRLSDMAASIRESNAWVGALDESGVLIGAARAMTDRKWVGRICDVIVHEGRQGQGVGHHLITTLLSHPLVRGCRFVRLGTKDRDRFYRTHGFSPEMERAGPFVSTALIRELPPQPPQV